MPNALERIRNEAKHIHGASYWAAERHYAAETPWYQANYWLGVPSVILAAIASASAFSNWKSGVAAGILSIAVAVLSSLNTFLNPNKKANAHHSSAKADESLYHAVGYFYRIESLKDGANVTELEKRLTKLSKDLDDLNKNSSELSGRAYRIAEEKIKNNRGEVVKDPVDDRSEYLQSPA
ncbi:MAG TPA: SLATT domain-containing protein [Stenomitos sp.]